MSLKIRLSRGGAKKRPFYRIVVADARMPRDGRFVEKIGTFDPLKAKDDATRLVLDEEKAKAWLAKGAQPTDRVLRLLDGLGLAKRAARRTRKRPSRRRRRRSAPPPRRRPPPRRPKRPRPEAQDEPAARSAGPSHPAGRLRRAAGRARRGAREVLTSDPKAIGGYGPLTDGKRARVFAFDSLRPLKDDMLVARVGGVSTREAAAALTGVEIFARRDQLPPPERRRILLRRSHRPRGRHARGRAARPRRRGHELRRRRHSRDRARRRRGNAAPAVHQSGRAEIDFDAAGSSSSRRAKSRTRTSVIVRGRLLRPRGAGTERLAPDLVRR